MQRYGKLAIIGLSFLTLAACSRIQPIVEIDRTLPPAQYSQEEISAAALQDAITRALIHNRWEITGQSQKQILARLNFRRHSASITVDYANGGYKILYRDSQALGYENGTIHKRYNTLVKRLDQSIQDEILVAHKLGQTSPTQY